MHWFDVKKYSIVATGTRQKDTLNTYRKLIKENGVKQVQVSTKILNNSTSMSRLLLRILNI